MRNPNITSRNILVALSLSLVPILFAQDRAAKPEVIHVSSEKVAAAFNKGGPILATNNFKIQAGHRTGPGEAELHDQDLDIFYILEGSATFVTGGTMYETRITDPGETRGKGIRGGVDRHLVKGDVIVIPNGVPHWFKEIDGTFNYYVIKVKQ